jgi:hypothetical protein
MAERNMAVDEQERGSDGASAGDSKPTLCQNLPQMRHMPSPHWPEYRRPITGHGCGAAATHTQIALPIGGPVRVSAQFSSVP